MNLPLTGQLRADLENLLDAASECPPRPLTQADIDRPATPLAPLCDCRWRGGERRGRWTREERIAWMVAGFALLCAATAIVWRLPR